MSKLLAHGVVASGGPPMPPPWARFTRIYTGWSTPGGVGRLTGPATRVTK